MIGPFASARKLPLRVACLGEMEYPQDDPVYRTYSVPDTLKLAECTSLAEAIACVEQLASLENIPTGDDDAVGFTPRLFFIRDGEGCLSLAGEPWHRGVKWCDPLASDGEAPLVVDAASKLRGEASIEVDWAN